MAKTLDRLPAACVSIIVSYLPISDLVNVCIGLGRREDIGYVIRGRKSPVVLFSKLVRDPVKLVTAMKQYRCIAGGSRVVDYFMPGSCSRTSDWDFFIRGEIDLRGMMQSFVCMGVKWLDTPPSGREGSSKYGISAFSVDTGHITTPSGGVATIQLISVMGRSVMDTILNFHSTVVQCFITNYAAFHMYGKVSRNWQTMVWHETNKAMAKDIEESNSSICLRKSAKWRLLRVMDHDVHIANNYTADDIEHAMGELREIKRRLKEQALDDSDMTALYETHPAAVELALNATRATMRFGDNMPMSTIVDDFLTRPRQRMDMLQYISSRCTCVLNTTDLKIEKYRNRGYEEIEFEDYRRGQPGWVFDYGAVFEGSEMEDPTPACYRVRDLLDEQCTVIKFTGCDIGTSDKVIESLTSMSRRFLWFEYYGGTVNSRSEWILAEKLDMDPNMIEITPS